MPFHIVVGILFRSQKKRDTNCLPNILFDQTLYSPNAYVGLLKQIKIKNAAPTCFGLQGNHHQGASQCSAKITHLVHEDYVV